jgi:hypothetical protein
VTFIFKNPFRSREMVALSDKTTVAYAEVHLAGTETQQVNGKIRKEILRTGHWPVIPTLAGTQKRPLTIIRDGKSDRASGVIALTELVDNFKRVGQRVQIPLTDDDNDHKNTIRLNTGFVTDIWIEDKGENDSRLVAEMDFTEKEVEEKVLKGTYADVSCGIPWEFSSRGERIGSYLEHVAITNRPFIDGLGPFFLALSDGDNQSYEREVIHFSAPGVEPPAPPEPQQPPAPPAPPEIRIVDPYGGLSLREIEEQGLSILPAEMQETFRVIDVKAKGIVVTSDEQKQTWLVPFKVEDGKLAPSLEGWAWQKYEGEAKPSEEQKPPDPSQPPVEPPAPPAKPEASGPEGDLEAARTLRRQRLGEAVTAANQYPTKEGNMPLSREELERLNLSDMPEGQRAVFQKLIDENSDLAMSSKEGSVNERITELENLGFKGHPGALKLYRRVMLGDDGGPAVVVLSDDGKQKESLTALSILDMFIEAIKGADGKVVLSDQAHLVPDDQKPPTNPGDQTSFEDRLAATKQALAGVHGG